MDWSGSMPGRRVPLWAAALLAWSAVGSAPAAEPPAARKPATHTVVMEATAFSPPALVVRRGDTVVWVNRDPFPHTVTAGDGTFDSKIVGPGRPWRHVARKPGEHQYGCTLHPTMKGKLTVE
jgi:plastocyanin